MNSATTPDVVTPICVMNSLNDIGSDADGGGKPKVVPIADRAAYAKITTTTTTTTTATT